MSQAWADIFIKHTPQSITALLSFYSARMISCTQALRLGLSWLLLRHSMAWLATGTARLPQHGCPATAPPAALCSMSPKASPQHPAELPASLCVLLCVCWAFWGCSLQGTLRSTNIPKKGALQLRSMQFFLEPSHARYQSHEDIPKPSPGSSAQAAWPRKGVWKRQEKTKSSW